jgi:hypothetical protein
MLSLHSPSVLPSYLFFPENTGTARILIKIGIGYLHCSLSGEFICRLLIFHVKLKFSSVNRKRAVERSTAIVGNVFLCGEYLTK